MCINTVENILKLRGIVDVAAEHFLYLSYDFISLNKRLPNIEIIGKACNVKNLHNLIIYVLEHKTVFAFKHIAGIQNSSQRR